MNAAAERLKRRGYVVLRGAIAGGRLAAVLSELVAYFDPLRSPDAEAGVARARRRSGVVSIGQAVAAGFPGLLSIVPAIAGSAIAEVLRAYFDDGVHVPLRHILLRHYHAGNGYATVAGFHQDISGADRRATVTSWIPLVPCGIDAPGLEFVAEPVDAPLAEIGEAAVLARYGDRLAHPAFAPGDAVLLRNTIPHRSFVSAAMTEPRYSIDLRYLPAAAMTPADPPEAMPTVAGPPMPAGSSRASRTPRGP